MMYLKRLIAVATNGRTVHSNSLPLLCMLSCAIPTAVNSANIQADASSEPVEVVDDANLPLRLDHAAKRIISLAPHITELVFAAGAGDRLVGVVAYSDYPSAALTIPKIGDSSNMDLERIIDLKPDLVIGWHSGNPARVIEKLRSLDLPIYLSEPDGFEGIARTLRNIGQLSGETTTANTAADRFLLQIKTLSEKYPATDKVTVFHPIWSDPLMTLGGDHIFSVILELCSGENIFNDLGQIAAEVSIESVHQRDPDIILASDQRVDTEALEGVREKWQSWSSLTAVKNDFIFLVQSDLIHRPTPRVADGAEQVCTVLEKVRKLQ